MELPKNVDPTLLDIARKYRLTGADFRSTADRTRKKARAHLAHNEYSAAWPLLREASKLKRIAQYLERGGA